RDESSPKNVQQPEHHAIEAQALSGSIKRVRRTTMNKGTAIVGFLLSFLAGMGLMWGIAHDGGVEIGAEVASKGGGSAESHASSPVPVNDDDPVWGNADALVTIVEISDFECPFCSRVVPTLSR